VNVPDDSARCGSDVVAPPPGRAPTPGEVLPRGPVSRPGVRPGQPTGSGAFSVWKTMIMALRLSAISASSSELWFELVMTRLVPEG
jgi:hypothetical protein